MQVTGAIIKEQGVTFAIVVVKPHAVANSHKADDLIAGFIPVFRTPVLLMAQDRGGRPTYYGRKDLAAFLSHVPPHAIPWREYSIN